MQRRPSPWLSCLGLLVLSCQPAPTTDPGKGGASPGGTGGRPAMAQAGNSGGGTTPSPGGGGSGSAGGASGGVPGAGGAAGSGGAGGDIDATGGTGGQTPADASPSTDAAANVESGPAVEPGPTPPGSARASVACGTAATPSEAFHTIKVGARDRRIFLRLPTGYDGKKPWPVLFGFHGAGNKDASWFDGKTGLTKANKGNAVVILGESLFRPGSTTERSWQDEGQLPENLAYVDASLDWLAKNVCIDPARVFAVGQSSGAFFSHTLGCQRGDVFRAAAASDGGERALTNCKGNPGIFIRYRPTGGDGGAAGRAVRDFWLERNACGTGAPQATGTPQCKAHTACKPGGLVWECTDTGSHDWPAYMDGGVWTFFSQFK